MLQAPHLLHRLPGSLCALALLALAAVACSDDPADNPGNADVLDLSTDADPDGAGQDTTPENCSGNADCSGANAVCDSAAGLCVQRCADGDCATGQVCDLTSGFCVAGDACTTLADCDAGEACSVCRGLCVPDDGKKPCVDANNCFSTQYCDPCTNLCEEKKAICETCIFHHECGLEDDLCIDIPSSGGRFCARSCATLNDCPEGYLCGDLGDGLLQCVPSSGDCSAPAECDADGDCLGGNEICRMGRCLPGCTTGGCPSGNVCNRGRCEPPCTEGSCPTPLVCDVGTGLCKVEGSCLDDRDCPGPEAYCDSATQSCAAGCLKDEHCWDATKECVAGACVPRGCKGAWSCAAEQVCNLTSKACEEAVGPYCDVCDPDVEGACGPEANKCLTLEDPDGNQGSFCLVGCSDDPDNVCPQGYACTELQDQDGNPAGKVCFRDCFVDPWG